MSTAHVSPDAVLGADVTIGHFSVVHPNVAIGDGTTIGDHCVIGQPCGSDAPLVVGSGSTIRSHSVLYEGSTIGDQLETGHHVLIRSGCEIGVNARLGTQTALEGNLRLGDYVRIQGYSIFGNGTQVDDFAFVFPQCVMTNDPLPPSHVCDPVHIGAGAVVCTGSTLLPGCRVGFGAFVASGARVEGDVPPASVVLPDGRPGGPVTHLMHLESGTRHPWTRHFADALPPEAQQRLAGLHFQVLAAARELRGTRHAAA